MVLQKNSNFILSCLLSILIVLVASVQLHGQNESFTASASKTTVGVNEQFQVTFTLNGNGANFQSPNFKDFNILMGPQTSTSVQFANGAMSQSISYTYVLQPKAEGTFQIGPATIKASKQLQSNPITIKVVKGNAPAQGQGKQQNGEGDVMAQIAENLFIKAYVSKTNVYQGESIFLTYKLYSRVNLVHFGLSKLPTLNGFWSQDLEMPKELRLHKEVLNGVEYNVAELKKTILFPQFSGSLTVDAIEGESIVRVQRKRQRSGGGYDPFDAFFNDPFFGGGFEDLKYTVKSEPVKIAVRALPSNAPESFSGAVGDFSMTAFLDKSETQANEPVTLKIKVFGSGNLKLIDPPKLKFPADLESYDPKISDNITVDKNGVMGSRTFEYLLIPRHAGEYKIPSVEFSYFNIGKKSYVPLSSKEFVITVTKGTGENTGTTSISGISKEEVKLLGKDIRYIKSNNPNLTKKDDYFFGSALFYTLCCLPFVVFAGFLIYRKKYMEENATESLSKSRKANRMAKKRLSLARKYLTGKQNKQFYEELAKALWGYVSDRLSIPVSDLSKESIAENLKQKNVSEESIKKLIVLLDHCEFVRYAPSAGDAATDATYNQAIEIIAEMEQQLKAKKK